MKESAYYTAKVTMIIIEATNITNRYKAEITASLDSNRLSKCCSSGILNNFTATTTVYYMRVIK